MSQIYFTSDTHYFHQNIIRFCGRPFKDAEEMNQTMIDNWNNLVKDNDTVYHIGDFSFGKALATSTIIKQLKGKIVLIEGNHDYSRMNRWLKDMFYGVYDLKEISIDNQKIVMCHFPFYTWNKFHAGSWNIHGHSHGTTPYNPEIKRLDVGVDCHNFTPIHFDRVKEILADENYKYPEIKETI